MAGIKKMGYCVNGEWKISKSDKYMDVTDSSTGEVIASVPCCTSDEVEEAIASAQAAFPEWSSLSLPRGSSICSDGEMCFMLIKRNCQSYVRKNWVRI